jgi:ribonucleotide reductase beta subunit family protein with ferritin-like domain
MLEKHLLPIEEYKEPIEFANQQLKIFWLPDEIKVEKDVQDILINMSESEKHAVIFTLKLFSLYETHAGDEYWSGRFKKMFDGNEFHRMAAVFSMFELAVHAPFYNKINELLHINTPEFYLSYQDTPVLVERMKHVREIIDHPDDLVSLAGFSMVEGAVLYSSFAFLKHFQSDGKNRLLNIVRGINFSVRDEAGHSVAGAWCFKHKKSKSNLTQDQELRLKNKVFELANTIYEHEKEIIRLTFSQGKIEGITETQMIRFVESRINECLKELGYEKLFDVKYNPIADYFYKGINNYVYADFFTGISNQYHRNWSELDFTWKVEQ